MIAPAVEPQSDFRKILKTDQGVAVAAESRKNPYSQSSPCLFCLKIELVDTTPRVWRRVLVDGRVSFATLHHVIQAATGWHDAHLHCFQVEENPYGKKTTELRTWAGLDFDPARFDRSEANAAISRMLWNRWIK
jgi:hypothetical protein